MTAKDYVLVASVLRSVKEDVENTIPALDAVDYVARRLATEMEKQNPRFKRDVFLKACGVTRAS